MDQWNMWREALIRSAEQGGVGVELVRELVNGYDLMALREEAADLPMDKLLSAQVGDRIEVGGGYVWEVIGTVAVDGKAVA